MPAIALGHLDQARQGVQSTKDTGNITDDDNTPSPIPQSTNQVIAQVISFQQNKKGFFDQTGAFPYTSSRGNRYIFAVLQVWLFDDNIKWLK